MSIGSRPFIYMRTDRFSEINKESEELLLKLIHCENGRTILYTGSGTGAMSAVVENYCSSKKKILVIDGGSFGHRWFQLCEYYRLPVIVFSVPFAKDINYDELADLIAKEHPDVLLCQHHETSSGQLFNISLISQICHKYDVSLVVDVISSFLAEPLNMDQLGIDICISSSQKGLNIPPGLSMIFISNRLLNYKFSHRGYYWDFEENLINLQRGQTPFSPATILFLQLNYRLKQICSEGGELANIQRVHQMAKCFRNLCRKYGWGILAETPSSAITGFQTKDGNRKIFNGLIEQYDTYIMPGKITGFYRVSHMGLQTEQDLISLAQRIHMLEIK